MVLLLAALAMAAGQAEATPSPEAQAVLRSARAQGLKITVEQAEQLARRQREVFGQLGALGLMQGQPAASGPALAAPASPQAVTVTEANLIDAVNTARADPRRVDIAGTNPLDLVIDGRRYLDPEGELANVSASADRNSATLLVGRSNSRVVKFVPLNNTAAALPVGTLSLERSGFRFEGVTGVRIAGAKFTLLPDGIMMWRDDALFSYRYGTAVASFALPAGYYPTDDQRGDIGATGAILVRKDRRGENGNQKAFRAAKGLLGMFGSSGVGASDFALYDTKSGKLIPLRMDDGAADQRLMDTTGQPNTSHYFWRADWVVLGQRRFVVYLAKSVQKLLVTDLDSGKTSEAFSRDLGITQWALKPTGNGSARIVANWMFKDHAIDDLVAWFDAAPAAAAPAAGGPSAS